MKKKAYIGMALVVFFAITLILGIILHLKSHGIVVQPRTVIKILHWVAGYVMSALLFVHWSQFQKVLTALRKRCTWFYSDTIVLIVLFIATFLTGTVKLLSPVKIPHLGLWHYALGIAMSIAAVIHLVKGLPTWKRMIKTAK